MLITRIITAIILISLVLLAIFYLPILSFAIVVAAVLALACWEWTALILIKSMGWRLLYILLIIFLFGVSLFVPVSLVLALGVLWWFISLYLLINYQRFTAIWSKGTSIRGLIGVWLFVPCWVGLSSMRANEHGSIMVLLFLLIIWATDTGAYFVGRYLGKHKLAPQVSPGKTIEGLFGGLISAFIVMAIFAIYFKFDAVGWFGFMVITLITSLVSVIGDLFESRAKREGGVKDSSKVLPGHGGILDRLDSMLAASPFFALGLLVLAVIHT